MAVGDRRLQHERGRPVTTQAAPVQPVQYDPVAEAYEERIVPRFRPIADALLDVARPAADEEVLELGAGSGGFSRLVLPCLGARGRLTITDVSEGMLDVARRVVTTAVSGSPSARPTLDIVEADLHALPFAAGGFDRVVAMLTPVQDTTTGLAEARRVLRAGGRLAIAFWGRSYAELDLLNAVRTEVGLPLNSGTPRSTVAGRLLRVGFGQIRSRELRLPVVHADAGAYLAYRRSFGVAPGISSEVYERYAAALRRRVEQLAPGSTPVELGWSIVIVTAVAV